MGETTWDDLTHEEKMALRADLYAKGILKRYNINLPRRFTPLSTLKWWRSGRGYSLGRHRSSARHRLRTRDRILWPRLRLVTVYNKPKKSHLPWGRWCWPRPYKRLHDAYLARP